MYHFSQRCNWFGLTVGLLTMACFLTDAQARRPTRRTTAQGAGATQRQTGRSPRRTTGQGGGAMQRQAGRQLIAELRNARGLLQQADHDYKGHRVQAMSEVTRAIRALEQHHGKTATGKTGGAKKGTGANKGVGAKKGTGVNKGAGGGESQQVSDTQLRQARQQLQTIHGQMQASHHVQAKGYVTAAIQHLNMALKIR